MVDDQRVCRGCRQMLLSSIGCTCGKQDWVDGRALGGECRVMDGSRVSSDLVFLNEYMEKERVVKLDGINQVFMFQQQFPSLHGTVWPSSVRLSEYLIEHVGSFGEGCKRSIELGAGLGLVSKVLGTLGWEAVATDRDPSLFQESTGTKSAVLDWGNHSATPRDILDQDYQLIVGADILHEKASFILLAQTVRRLIDSNTNPTCLICYQVRNPEDEHYFRNIVLSTYGMEAHELEDHVSSGQLTPNHVRYTRIISIVTTKGTDSLSTSSMGMTL